MKRVFFYFLFLLISACRPENKPDNQYTFESKKYKNEEELAYSQLLEKINYPPARNPRNLLFFLKIDSLESLDIDREEKEYLVGKLRSRKLDLMQINKYDNLKVLFIPTKLGIKDKSELDSIYWNYRKKYRTTAGTYTLSRIGFNQEFTNGKLKYTYIDAFGYKSGCHLHIIKADGKWLIDRKEVCSPLY